MKRLLPWLVLLLCGVVAGILISGAVFAFTGFSVFGKARNDIQPAAELNNAELAAVAFRVLEYIRDGDYVALSGVSHPERGVVFSPHATVTLSTSRFFLPDQIAAFRDDTTVYVWGIRSGSGEPIELTPLEYFDKFVFDKDYTAAAVIGVDHIVRSGNALENITEVFPDVRFVDFHVTGDERDSADDFAWSSLRLGFEEYGGSFLLTVVLHSMWTE